MTLFLFLYVLQTCMDPYTSNHLENDFPFTIENILYARHSYNVTFLNTMFIPPPPFLFIVTDQVVPFSRALGLKIGWKLLFLFTCNTV